MITEWDTMLRSEHASRDAALQLDMQTAIRMSRLHWLLVVWVAFILLALYAQIVRGEWIGWLLCTVLAGAMTVKWGKTYLNWLQAAGEHAYDRELRLLPPSLDAKDLPEMERALDRYNHRVEQLRATFGRLRKQVGPAWTAVTPARMHRRVDRLKQLDDFKQLETDCANCKAHADSLRDDIVEMFAMRRRPNK